MRFIDLIWYKLYGFSQKSKFDSIPNLGASFLLSFCVQLNMIFVSYTLWFFFEIPDLYKKNFFLRASLIALILTLIFFFIYRGKRGQRVIVGYLMASPTQQKKDTVLATFYFILTGITAVFGGGILRWIKYGYFPL